MHKELLLLGLLQSGHHIGYELHRIVTSHGDLYADLKRGNVYYLLDRLAESGAVEVRAEAGARGPRRERLIYTITDLGRQRFHDLIREVLRTYELPHTGLEVGVSFLPYVPPDEAIELLEERQQAVRARRALVEERKRRVEDHFYIQLAQDHLLSLMDAELAWIDRTLAHLRQPDVLA
jgi:DNA-binding PadR family transcriptional regulator